MVTTLDIIFSLLLGGLLFMSIINSNSVVSENSTIINGQMSVQQMLVSTAQIVEGEFRNMGMGVDESELVVISAYDTAIAFRCDLDRNGTIDTISYWLGPTSELSQTQNEYDRFIHRRVNKGGVQSIGIVTRFNLKYFSQNELDTLTPPVSYSDLSMIKIVEITMEVQTSHGLYRDPRDVKMNERNAVFPSSFWRQTRLASQNLKR